MTFFVELEQKRAFWESHPTNEDKLDYVITEIMGGDIDAVDWLKRNTEGFEELSGIIGLKIERPEDIEDGIPSSTVHLQFNPHRKSLITSISVAGLSKRVLSEDKISNIRKVTSDSQILIVENDTGRIVRINEKGRVLSEDI